MQFTEEQKRIIKMIAEEQVYDYISFALCCYPELFTVWEKTERTDKINNIKEIPVSKINYNNLNSYTYICSDPKAIKEHFKNFLNIIIILSEYHLIIKIREKTKITIDKFAKTGNIYKKQQIQDNVLKSYKKEIQYLFTIDPQLITPTLWQIHIIPTAELKMFIENDFLTGAELFNHQSLKKAEDSLAQAKKGNRTAIIVAVISLSLSIIFNLLGFFYQMSNKDFENLQTTNRKELQLLRKQSKDQHEKLLEELKNLKLKPVININPAAEKAEQQRKKK